MAWASITEADVLTNLNTDEVAAYRNKRAASQSDPIATIVEDVASEIRGYVAVRWPITATGIPQALRNAAIDIAIYRICKRCHTNTESQRKPAADDAVLLLQRVAEGTFAVESDASTIATEATQTGSVSTPTLTFDADSQDGL